MNVSYVFVLVNDVNGPVVIGKHDQHRLEKSYGRDLRMAIVFRTLLCKLRHTI